MTAFMNAGHELVAAAKALGPSAMAVERRALVVLELFRKQEQSFAGIDDPTDALVRCMEQCAKELRALPPMSDPRIGTETSHDIETVTGSHYGNLFAGFSPETYWNEPTQLLTTRLERNGVATSFVGKTVLDAGCGGGRYTVAWSKLGAARVVGIDISPLNIRTAEARASEAGLTNVEYRLGNVLALPVESASFDVVFSNGVLHHTLDWRVGLTELLRALAPEGIGWLYLIERPGGLFWDTIDVLRAVMNGDSHDIAREALQREGLPQNRVFYMLDHVMAPINERLTPDEISGALEAAGACDIRRLTRGADFDRIEQIHRGSPFATVKFGVGENRYVFTRR